MSRSTGGRDQSSSKDLGRGGRDSNVAPNRSDDALVRLSFSFFNDHLKDSHDRHRPAGLTAADDAETRLLLKRFG